MHFLSKATAIVVVAITLAGCSDKPSQSDGAQAFTAQLRKQLGDTPFVIQRFAQTNGQMQELYGVKVYVMEYAATVKYPNGLHPNCAQQGNSFGGLSCFRAQVFGMRPQPVGAVDTTKGQLIFEKTERGWRGPDGFSY